ncbi:TPA: hypothetical protein O4H64_000918 [Vibrio alginolyticus]|nr:hypothetical protein [Vibrio alginolyticus]
MKLTNYHWNLFANLSQSIFAWLILLSMVKTGNQTDLGVYTYIQSIVLPIQLFFTLKLRTIQNADFDNEFSYFEYHNLRFVMSVLNMVIVALFVLAFDVDNKLVYLVMALTYSLYIIRESYISLVQKINRNDVFFKMNLISGTVSFLCFILPYILFKELALSLFLSFFSRFLIYIFVEKKLAEPFIDKLKSKNIARGAYQRIFIRAWPLAITALTSALFTSIPRVLIEKELGINDLAIYGALSSLLFFINILVNSFVQSSLPDFARLYNESLSKFVGGFISIITKLLVVSMSCSVLVYFFGEQFLTILFTSEYADYTKELMFIFISGVSLSLFSVGNLLLSSQKSFNVQLPIYVIVALLIFISSYLLIPNIGMLGAICSQIIGYIVGFILCLLYFKFKCNNTKTAKA